MTLREWVDNGIVLTLEEAKALLALFGDKRGYISLDDWKRILDRPGGRIVSDLQGMIHRAERRGEGEAQ